MPCKKIGILLLVILLFVTSVSASQQAQVMSLFYEGWEAGTISPQRWTSASSPGTYGSIDIQDATGCSSPNSGSKYLWTDVTTNNNYETNILKTAYDFTGASNIILEFYTKETGDEQDVCSDHAGNFGDLTCDGALFTCDGTNWKVLWQAPTSFSSWTKVWVNVSNNPNFCQDVNSNFAIKFMQRDNYMCTTDGIGWDDINISYNTPYFFEDWESSAAMTDRWQVTGTNQFRTQVTTANGPYKGLYHLTMDDTTGDAIYSLNELTTKYDFTDAKNLYLRFYWKEFTDESNTCPSSWTGSTNGDCVAFTCDGTTWYKLLDLTEGSSTYALATANISAHPNFCSSPLDASFAVRFQQYDNYPIASDGIALDNIRVDFTRATCGGSVPCECGDRLVNSRQLTGQDPITTTRCRNPIALRITNTPNPGSVTLRCNRWSPTDTDAILADWDIQSPTTGIYVDNFDNVRIDQCVVGGFDRNLDARDGKNFTIFDSMFYANRTALFGSSEGGAGHFTTEDVYINTVDNVNLIRNIFTGTNHSFYNVFFMNSKNFTIEGNYFELPLLAGIYHHSNFWGSKKAQANTFRIINNNTQAPSKGGWLRGNSAPNFTGSESDELVKANSFYVANNTYGIFLQENTNNISAQHNWWKYVNGEMLICPKTAIATYVYDNADDASLGVVAYDPSRGICP